MRRLLDRTVRAAAAASAGAIVLLVAGVAGFVLRHGGPPLGRAASGAVDAAAAYDGLLYPLAGTLILLATTLAISAPLAIGTALVHSVLLPVGAWRTRLRVALYALNGVPSIVFGIFGFLLFCQRLGWGKSWLAGGIVLAFMILPTMAVALLERIDALPREQIEAAYGLGLARQQIVTSVILPQAWPGLVSGTLIGLARAAGETAPILFTAAVFSGARLPRGVVDSPVLALPYRIFVSAQDSLDPAAQGEVWSAALVLLVVALSLGVASLPLRRAGEVHGG